MPESGYYDALAVLYDHERERPFLVPVAGGDPDLDALVVAQLLAAMTLTSSAGFS